MEHTLLSASIGFLLSLQDLGTAYTLLLLLYYYYKLFDLCMVDLTMLLVGHCHIECRTIGLSIIEWLGMKEIKPSSEILFASFLQDSGKQQDFKQKN
jgi:hypothetical protein